MNDVSEASFRRHYPHLIRKITPRRDAVELGDAIDLATEILHDEKRFKGWPTLNSPSWGPSGGSYPPKTRSAMHQLRFPLRLNKNSNGRHRPGHRQLSADLQTLIDDIKAAEKLRDEGRKRLQLLRAVLSLQRMRSAS